jgi:hypothetical protein
METVKNIFKKIGSILGFKVSLPIFLEVLVFVGIVYVSISYFRGNPSPFGLVKGPSIIKEEEDRLIKRVGQLIDLPSDERPTIATVSDKTKVKDQPFFGKAENGDKVLIYTNNKRVILYRPGEDRIVEVGSVNINQQVQGTEVNASSTPTPTPKPTESPVPVQ